MQIKKPLKDLVVNGIYHDIEEGVYRPNDILTENLLVEKYHISKSPIREALVELCKDNVLKSLPRLGYQVVPITLKEVVDILEFRLDIELCSLERSLKRMTEADLGKLRQLELVPPDDKDMDVAPNWTRNQMFHLELCGLGGNEYTVLILENTLKQSSRYISQYFRSAWNNSVESNGKFHIAILEALEERNLEKAKTMLEKDIMAVKEEIQQIYSL